MHFAENSPYPTHKKTIRSDIFCQRTRKIDGNCKTRQSMVINFYLCKVIKNPKL